MKIERVADGACDGRADASLQWFSASREAPLQTRVTPPD